MSRKSSFNSIVKIFVSSQVCVQNGASYSNYTDKIRPNSSKYGKSSASKDYLVPPWMPNECKLEGVLILVQFSIKRPNSKARLRHFFLKAGNAEGDWMTCQTLKLSKNEIAMHIHSSIYLMNFEDYIEFRNSRRFLMWVSFHVFRKAAEAVGTICWMVVRGI